AAAESDLDRAIESANAAFGVWSTTSLDVRRALLSGLADLIRDNTEQLARLLTVEQGKPLAEARAEVAGGEALFRYYAELRSGDAELFREEAATHVRTHRPLG